MPPKGPTANSPSKTQAVPEAKSSNDLGEPLSDEEEEEEEEEEPPRTSFRLEELNLAPRVVCSRLSDTQLVIKREPVQVEM